LVKGGTVDPNGLIDGRGKDATANINPASPEVHLSGAQNFQAEQFVTRVHQ
jgi:hypothetical protein